MDHGDSGGVGIVCLSDGARSLGSATLCFAVFTWVSGGRVFSGSRIVFDVLVSAAGTGAVSGIVSDRPAGEQHRGSTDLGLDPRSCSLDARSELALVADAGGVSGHRFGVATYFILPSNPVEAKFLSREERDWVVGALEREKAEKSDSKQVSPLQALAIWRVWHAGLIVFLSNCGVYMLTFWMPQLIKGFSGQISNSAVGRLAMIPYIVGLIAMVFVSRSSDKRFERKFHAAIPAVIAGTAMAFLGAPHTIGFTIALLAASIAGMISVYGPAYSLPSEMLSGPAVAAGLGLASSIANSAGFVGPYAAGWISQRTGSLYGGLAAAGISLFLCAMLALLLPTKLRRV